MGIIKETVRQLRRDPTESEAIVWDIIRNRQINGLKFYRQHPLRFEYENKRRFFVADFYCAELKLVIEIDGKIHEKRKEYDELRTFIINQLGIQVIRFTNADVQNTSNLIEQLLKL